MYILGIETSCDETSVAIVDDKFNILSNVVSSQIDIHKQYGGVVPEIASRNHIENIMPVLDEALSTAGLKINDIDAVAATVEPGLPGAVMVGRTMGESLAFALDKPYRAVNHLYGHIASLKLTNKDLEPPFLCLLVSGGHTSIYYVKKDWKTELLISTADDAVGESYDKVSRVLGLGYPGGPAVSKMTKDNYSMPPFVSKSPVDKFSFSGLKTAVLNFVNKEQQKGNKLDITEICSNFSDCAINQLLARSIEKIKKYKVKSFGICGGVSANKELRKRFSDACENLNVKLFLPSSDLCGDNAAMIAAASILQIK